MVGVDPAAVRAASRAGRAGPPVPLPRIAIGSADARPDGVPDRQSTSSPRYRRHHLPAHHRNIVLAAVLAERHRRELARLQPAAFQPAPPQWPATQPPIVGYQYQLRRNRFHQHRFHHRHPTPADSRRRASHPGGALPRVLGAGFAVGVLCLGLTACSSESSDGPLGAPRVTTTFDVGAGPLPDVASDPTTSKAYVTSSRR